MQRRRQISVVLPAAPKGNGQCCAAGPRLTGVGLKSRPLNGRSSVLKGDSMKRSRIAPGRAGLRERQELRRLTAHSSRLWQIRDLQEGLQEILRASIELLNADKGSIHLVDDETGTL